MDEVKKKTIGKSTLISIIYVKYMDHVLFKNVDHTLFKEPIIREAIGWIVKENDECLWICFDKPVERLPHEKSVLESGLLIVKRNILERRKVE